MNDQPKEAFFRSIIEQAPTAIGLLKGRDMILEVCNTPLLAIWGKDPSITGKPLVETLPQITDQGYLALLQQVYDTGKPFTGQGIRAMLQPDEIYLDFTYTPLRDDGGAIMGVIIMATDVTEQYMARQQVIEAESSLREAIELAELATWGIDPATGAIWYSDRMKRWIGVSGDERDFDEGMNPVPETDRDRVRIALEKAMLPESDGKYDLEHNIRNIATGRERIIHAQARVFFDATGKPMKMVGTAQDVTTQRSVQMALEQQVQQRTEELDTLNEELQATNEELHTTNEELATLNEDLMQSNDALQQFAHVASHDLKEPLRKIKTFLGRIEADKETVISDHSKNFMNRVYIAADRMFAMISGVLAYSTINASEQQIQTVDLQETIQQLEVDLEVLIAQKNASIRYSKLPKLEGAAVLIQQLFYNLVINALKFSKTDEPSVVTIESSPMLQNNIPFAKIDVCDNGIGFDPQQADRIFNTFIRLNSKDKYEGTGLGLSLCKKIVTRHGGTITAAGNTGEGAVFTILLPLKQTTRTI